MREPRVENKYNLTVEDIRSLEIANRNKICEPLFRRNNHVGAWYISKNTIKDKRDAMYNTYSDFWLGVRDGNPDKVDLKFSSFGGMATYEFNDFYCTESIDNEIDLILQEKVLETVNLLIDEGVLRVKGLLK